MNTRHVARRPEAPEQSPLTPSHGAAHNAISDIIAKIENTWHLGLNANSDRTWSPSASSGRQKRHDDCHKLIKFLYFKDRDSLYRLLDKFDTLASWKDPEIRLGFLLQLLREHQREPQTRRVSSLQDRLQDARSSPLSQSMQTTTDVQGQSSRRPPPLKMTQGLPLPTDISASQATEPSTPVAEQADPMDRPASPVSPSVRASARKETAAQHPSFPRHDSHMPSPEGRPKKRVSDEALNTSPSKVCKTSDYRPKWTADGVFAVPAPKAASFARRRQNSFVQQPAVSAAASFTSATTATTSLNNSQWSSYRELPTTANTSFASVATEAEPEVDNGAVFHSSGTISFNSQERQEMINVAQSFDSTSKGLLNEAMQETRLESPVVDTPRTKQRMEQHQLANLPFQGLGQDGELSERLSLMPFKFRWEIVRLALAHDLDPDVLLPRLGDKYRDYDAFWDYLSKHEACRKLKMPVQGSTKAWDAAENKFENVSLKADLVYNTSNRGPFFKLSLKPLETEKSCRFQRAFGGDRFLYVQVPPIRGNFIPRGKGTEEEVRLRYEEWLVQPDKPFLGRYWTIFHVENIKSKTVQRAGESKATRQRLVLFATHGYDINLKPEQGRFTPRKSGSKKVITSSKPEASVAELLDWFMPLRLNAYQPFTKAFARLDLGLSRTDAGIKFIPSQVRFIKDTLADGSVEDPSFNDQNYRWTSPHDIKKPQVMNDGCSRISIGALRDHWRNKSLPGPVPSAVQGRIGGAKGVWMISASTDTTDPEHLEHWIEISESQLKFKPHPEDSSNELYDQNRLLFEPLASSAPPSSSSLNKAFFPILLDRGVRKERLGELVTTCLDRNRKALLEAMGSPDDLRKWVATQNSLSEERNRDGTITWQGGLPIPLGEKVVLLLESGFNPQECPYLAHIVVRMVNQDLLRLRHKFDIPVARSTFVLGIADPIGVLEPGEVHLMFSQNFSDDVTGESKMYLDNLEVLVARHPALRNSDVQKVKAVFKKELDHLRDVIVFPSKGQFPLAGKLQGGDYDGDRFWVSWEPSLTNGFKNAPAPYTSPKPEDYGISVDRRTLGEIRENQWLQESFKFRNKPELLGVVTKLHGRVSYKQNKIDSPIVNKLVDLHDLLVDSSKNGYVFDDAAYKKFVTTQLRINLKDIKNQAYEEGMQQDELNRRKHGKTKPLKLKYNRHHILDHLYWEIIVPHTDLTLSQLSTHFESSLTLNDPCLLAPFEDEAQNAKNENNVERMEALEGLVTAVKELRPLWNRLTSKNPDLNNPDDYNDALDKTYSRYLSIKTTIPDWLQPVTPGGPRRWDMLRASAFAAQESEIKVFSGERTSKWASGPNCLFHIAGRELALIKALGTGDWRVLVRPVWAGMKMRRGKRKEPVEAVVEVEAWESEGEGEGV